MRGKKLLAAFLLSVGLCFVPVLGYGEIEHGLYEIKTSYMKFCLLEARVSYMMANPDTFLLVSYYYDLEGGLGRYMEFPRNVDTKRKILIRVQDNRGIFSYRSGTALLSLFKEVLEPAYLQISVIAREMNTDIVAKFLSGKEISLGYFYQGEYHLWEE